MTTVLNVLKSGSKNPLLADQNDLIDWYRENRRELPWRKNRDPYRIWISEVMLQQTTVAAVIPYYERFLKRFPTLQALAEAKEHDVIENWAGLGYYSRARNLHKAAQALAQAGFFETAEELLELPGFGPYTSRAVASLAFNEKVGVLDGNVIRVLSRRFGLKLNWWNTKERKTLQDISDQLAQTEHNADINQGLMELGATVCTPKKPTCLLCPWKTRCVALKTDQVANLPLPKPRDEGEIWHWIIRPQFRGEKVFLTPLEKAPFLKNHPFPESVVQRVSKKPAKYHFKHGVTKYDLYITVEKPKKLSDKTKLTGQWVKLSDVKKINPTSLMTKILKFSKTSDKLE